MTQALTPNDADARALEDASASPLAPDQIDLLEGLCARPELTSLDDFGGDDRVFLTGVARKLRERRLDMLMLPEASLKLSELLRQGDRPIAQYVSVVGKDAALSIEVLKAANSAFYAGASQTASLHDAVMRLGSARLQSILMMTSLKARVLKAGRLQGNVDVVLDLALPIGFVASQIARANKRPTDPCFMRGMLLHVEHLMILGMVNDIAREHRAPLTLSTKAIVQAFARFGPELRAAVAQAWQLETILLGGTATGDELDYSALRHVVICKWLGYELPTVPHVSPDLVEAVVKPLKIRVSPVVAGRAPDAGGADDAEAARRWLDDYLKSEGRSQTGRR